MIVYECNLQSVRKEDMDCTVPRSVQGTATKGPVTMWTGTALRDVITDYTE